jgi:class 3 adenylate cyclase
MTTQPPSGTVTFLLTDLEGSTRLWSRIPTR